MRMFFVRLLVCLALLTIGAALPVHAQETPTSQSALAVSPAIIEQVLEPGKPVSVTLQVNNVTSFPLPIKTVVRNFVVQSTELEATERQRLDASQWFKIDEPDFILQPKQVRTVKGTIIPPADAVPGGHYATVYFQPLIPHEALSPSTAYMNSQVGVLAFLVVKGELTQQAEYARPLASPGFVQQGPIDFSFAIHNTGNTHIMPQGKLRIYDWRGKEAGHIDLPAGIILPDATKEYTLAWDAAGALGKFRGELEVTYGIENTQLGKVSATVWIVPWVAIAITLTTLFAVVIFVIKTNHRWRKAWRVLRGKDMRLGS